MLENKVVLAIATSSQKDPTKGGQNRRVANDAGKLPLPWHWVMVDVFRTGSRIGVLALDEALFREPVRTNDLESGRGGTRTRKTYRSFAMYPKRAVECVSSSDWRLLPKTAVRMFANQMTDEVVNQSRYGALPLSYDAAIASRAGGIRTHNLRLPKHVLQLGSRQVNNA
jgi:hypothetical protein